MLSIDVIAPGRMKQSPFAELWRDYESRLKWNITLHELDTKSIQDEEKQILARLSPSSKKIMLDEKGKSIASSQFAGKIQTWMNEGSSHIQFIIGGADGLTETVKKNADLMLGFGIQTWPHMLVRVMLIEQIYRSEQILAGHPYHRD